MALELTFEGLPNRTLHIWLFRDVQNCSDIQEKVRSQGVEPECAFIDATLVADCWLVHLAAFKALAADSRAALKTKSLHGELVHNLSGTKHIGESFKRYGIQPKTRHLLVCRFDLKPGEEEAIARLVDGQVGPLSGLDSLADMQTLQKFHKMTAPELQTGDPVGSIATRMAARDC